MGRNIFDSDVNNTVNTRSVYPEGRGPTTAGRAGAMTPYTAGTFRASDGGDANSLTDSGAAPESGGVLGKPVSWWIVLVLATVGLMYSAQRFGSQGEDFKTIKLSVYNIIVITLAAMIGFGAFKVIFGRFKVPGWSDYVAAV